jgi:hypothetical protein
MKITSKAYILRNVGDLDRNHLEEEGQTTDIPRILRLTGAKSVVGRVSSSAVNLAVGVATVSSAHAMVDLTPGMSSSCHEEKDGFSDGF